MLLSINKDLLSKGDITLKEFISPFDLPKCKLCFRYYQINNSSIEAGRYALLHWLDAPLHFAARFATWFQKTLNKECLILES